MSRKDFKLVQDVPIVNILLDVGNARIRDGHDQRDCIARILRKEEQLMALMADIAEKDLTTMPILVKPAADGMWTVMDGNRRITALKLLNDPKSSPEERLKPSIQTLRKKFASRIPTAIDVLASSNEEAIAREMLARHSGAQGGIGQLNWSAYLRTVFLLNHGHPPDYKRPGQYALWAEKQGISVDDDFPITSLQRFFTVENLALLGFKIEGDELMPCIAPDSAKRMAQVLMTDFSNLTRVDDVRTPALARAYIVSVRARVGLSEPEATPPPSAADVPSDGSSAVVPASSTSRSESSSTAATPSAGVAATPSLRPLKTAPSPKTPPWDRKQLLGKGGPGLSIPDSETKARLIVTEIRQLDVKSTPLAAAMLLRHLIELSSDYYRATKKLPRLQKEVLARSVIASATHMRDSHTLSTGEFDIVNRLAQPGGVDLLQLETLQKIMHRDTHRPDFQTINVFWDNIAPFVRACWAS